jgi:hypothetical protein
VFIKKNINFITAVNASTANTAAAPDGTSAAVLAHSPVR